MSQTSMESPLWNTLLDGRYRCMVNRQSDTVGILTVTDATTDIVILSKTVSLAYGAMFGPDIDDVIAWQDASVEAVDALT